jgi:N-acetylglutamate synthase-like GNAT family acetyltransferase
MKIRKAGAQDIAAAVELAAALGLDYPGMENDRIWVAEDQGRIMGLVALRSHPDCRELVSLGVDPEYRNRGLGRKLVEALVDEAEGDIHLATIIPRFFEAFGFVETTSIPEGMAKDPSWCDGCPKELCSIMVRIDA